MPLLPAFLDRHPALRIDLSMSDRYEDLIVEGADVALRLGRLADSSFVGRRLASARRLVVAAPSYLQRRGLPATIADLASHDCLRAEFETSVWKFRHGGREASVTVEPRLRTSSSVGLVACAVAGLGIAVASEWQCEEELRSGALVSILAQYTPDPLDVWMIFPAGRQPARRARVFADYLTTSFAAEGPK